MTKSAEKKLAKKLEADAKKAAKQSLKDESAPAAGEKKAGGAKKEKPVKEVKVEPEWNDKTIPGQKKGESKMAEQDGDLH